MVVGIDKFREHFAGHEKQYAIIGGSVSCHYHSTFTDTDPDMDVQLHYELPGFQRLRHQTCVQIYGMAITHGRS